MRILIDTTFALRGTTGTGVYLERLSAALAQLGVEVLETQLTSRRPSGHGGVRSAVNAAHDAWWTQVELPRRAREANADVLHHPLPAHARRTTAAQVVTVHDLAFERLPDRFDPAYRRYASVTHKRAARQADAVIAVSHTTALDIRARWGVPQQSIVIARHGPGQEPATGRRPVDPVHFLYVGDDEPRKNLSLLLAAYGLYREAAGSQAAAPLVLAGTARGYAGVPGVIVHDRPDPAALTELYARAIALVHPSLHEGFGLTPLEAMGAGAPVIAARSPGVTETCADVAAYVDPRDPHDLAAVLAGLQNDDARRRDMIERGRRHAAAFSWARSAREHIRAYALAIERAHATSPAPAPGVVAT